MEIKKMATQTDYSKIRKEITAFEREHNLKAVNSILSQARLDLLALQISNVRTLAIQSLRQIQDLLQ